MKRKAVLVIGAGLSGLSLAYFLKKKKIRAQIFEKEVKLGGLCRSREKQGFTFDSSGHLLHCRNANTLSLVNKVLGCGLVKHNRKAYVYTFDKFIPYPFQANFNHLPKRAAEQCLRDFIKANKQNVSSENFLEWIHSKFGKGIAKYFMVPYNRKVWKTPLDRLQYKWAERLIVVPTIKQVRESVAKEGGESLGYNKYFWYPKKGGIEGLTKGFASGLGKINLSCQVVRVDLKKKMATFEDGRKERFDKLLSTIPLPELGKIITEVPERVRRSFKKLSWVSVYNVNFGLKNEIAPGRHWTYFSQKNIPFFRIGFFHNFSSYLAPRKRGSLYADISYSRKQPIRRRVVKAQIRKCLTNTGIIRDGSDILCEDVNDIEYGYPVYDKNYTSARSRILKFLSRNNILSCGRYGSWRYLSMEDVISEAERIVKNKL